MPIRVCNTNLLVCESHDVFIHHIPEIIFGYDPDVSIVYLLEQVGQCVEVGMYCLPKPLLNLINWHQCLRLVPHLLL